MATVSNIEAAALAIILEETENQLDLLKYTLLPDAPAPTTNKIRLDCPGLQVPDHEQKIWKTQQFSKTVRDAISQAKTTLNKEQHFQPLLDASADLNKARDENKASEEVFEKHKVLMKDLELIKRELANLKEEMNSVIYPGMLRMLQHEHEQEEQAEIKKCEIRKRYWEKFYTTKLESNLKRLKYEEESIKTNISKINTEIAQEMRNTEEMQKYLQASRMELANELDRCMELQDQLAQEREHQMLVKRIRKDDLAEMSGKGQVLCEKRAEEVEALRMWKEDRYTAVEAITVVQTWWRQQLQEDPGLIYPPKREKTKTKKPRT